MDRQDDVRDVLYQRRDPDPSAALWRTELQAMVERAIEALPEGLRGPLLQRHIDELGYQEIALRHQITPAAARKRCQLARDRIRQALREVEPEY